MTAINSKQLHIFAAKQFKEGISEQADANVFFAYGHAQAWPTDVSPPIANTSTAAFNQLWDGLIGAKKITGNDLRHVIPRFDWTANTVYRAYDDQIDSKLFMTSNSKFYVVKIGRAHV